MDDAEMIERITRPSSSLAPLKFLLGERLRCWAAALGRHALGAHATCVNANPLTEFADLADHQAKAVDLVHPAGPIGTLAGENTK